MTSTPAGGHLFLAENGALDGKSADFQCQWVETCTVSVSDQSVNINFPNITTCYPADGGSTTLCDKSKMDAITQAANQARFVLQTYHWYQGLCEPIDPGGLLCRTVTRDEFRAKAQADCSAKNFALPQRNELCQNVADDKNGAASARLFHCCTKPINVLEVDAAGGTGGAPTSGSGGAGGSGGATGGAGSVTSGSGAATAQYD